MNLIAVVLRLKRYGVFPENDLDRFRDGLLPAEHDCMFDRRVEVALADLWMMGACSVKQVSQDVIDARDFLSHILYYRSCGAVFGQVTSYDLDNPRDSSEGVANFVRQTRCHLSERGQMFGARHLRSMKALNFSAVLS